MGGAEYRKINLKKTCISGIQEEESFLGLVWAYRDSITLDEEIIYFIISLNGYNEGINTRVKTRNSIKYKIESYLLHHENDRVPINKCLNDLFGIRIMISNPVSHEEIRRHMAEKIPLFKMYRFLKGWIYSHTYLFQTG